MTGIAFQLVAMHDAVPPPNLVSIARCLTHLALIAAVAQIGGMGKLTKFYENFRDIRNQLQDAGALPPHS